MGTKRNQSPNGDSDSFRRVLGLVNLAGKIALSIAILYCVILCLSLFVDSKPSPQNTTATASEEKQPEWDMQNYLGGNWIFADLPWSVQTQTLPQREATELFAKAVPVLKSVESSEDDASDLSLITELLVGLDAHPQTRDGNTFYQLQTGPIQVVAFAPVQSPRQIQIARVLYNAGDGMLNYFELSVSSRTIRPANLAEVQLLPMQRTANRLAVRLDKENQICGELYELAEPLDVATKHWMRNGWRVRSLSSLLSKPGESIQPTDAEQVPTQPISTVDPSDPRGPSQDAQPFACLRGNEMVVAVPLPSVTKDTLLFLMRP